MWLGLTTLPLTKENPLASASERQIAVWVSPGPQETIQIASPVRLVDFVIFILVSFSSVVGHNPDVYKLL